MGGPARALSCPVVHTRRAHHASLHVCTPVGACCGRGHICLLPRTNIVCEEVINVVLTRAPQPRPARPYCRGKADLRTRVLAPQISDSRKLKKMSRKQLKLIRKADTTGPKPLLAAESKKHRK